MLTQPATWPSSTCVALCVISLLTRHCHGILLRDGLQRQSSIPHAASYLASRTSTRREAPVAIKLRNHIGVQYIGPVSFGEQSFGAIYDTGSFEAIVLSTRCSACGDETLRYDHTISNSFRPLDNESHVHVFGSGPVLARRSLETMRLGGPSTPWEVEDMPFWEVEKHNLTVWSNEDGAKFSAIVGLGPGSDVPGSEDESLMGRLHVTDFAYCLEQGTDGAGWLTLTPSMEEAGYSFSRIPLVGQNYWAVKLSNVSFAPNALSSAACQSGSSGCVAIVDTGTSLIGIPQAAYDKIMQGVPHVEEDCSNLAELPSLHFRLGDIDLSIPPKIWVLRMSRRTIAKAAGEDLGTPICWPAFTRVEKVTQLGDLWILGLPFFRYFYTVFDRGPGEPGLSLAVADGHCQGGGATTMAVTSPLSTLPAVVDASHTRLPHWARDASPAYLAV